MRAIDGDHVRVQVTLTNDQCRKLERVRDLASHVKFDATLADLIEIASDEYLKRRDPMLKQRKVFRDENCKQGEAT